MKLTDNNTVFKILEALGDSHNFNQKVELIEVQGALKVRKPRTVFWEYLLLDPKSEFRALLRSFKNSKTDNYLGNISYDIYDQPEFGICEYLNYDNKHSKFNSDKLFENYSRLIVFSTIFGITDLHSDNIKINQKFLQVCDIECIFFKSNSPLDSLLIPREQTEKNKTIFTKLNKIINFSKKENICLFMEYIYEEFNFYKLNIDKILAYFKKKNFIYSTYPIRILVRKTQDYYNKNQNNVLKFPYFKEEEEQMDRLDIPYFYGYLNKKDIFFLSGNKLEKKLTSCTKVINQKIEKSFTNFEKIFENDRLDSLMKNSLMVILKKITKNKDDFDLKTKNLRIIKKNKLLQIFSEKFKIQNG